LVQGAAFIGLGLIAVATGRARRRDRRPDYSPWLD